MASRRVAAATLPRPPAPNWDSGMRRAFAALYGELPALTAEEAAHLERECAAVPYRSKRQADLPLPPPERSPE